MVAAFGAHVVSFPDWDRSLPHFMHRFVCDLPQIFRAFCLFALLALSAVFLAHPALAQAPASPLISARMVEPLLGQAILLDMRGEAESFAREGHIPGSILITEADLRELKRLLPRDGVPARWPALPGTSSLLSSLSPTGHGIATNRPIPRIVKILVEAGARAERPVLIASRGLAASDMMRAAELYLALRSLGLRQVAVIDGGVAAWAIEGLPIARVPDAAPSVPIEAATCLKAQDGIPALGLDVFVSRSRPVRFHNLASFDRMIRGLREKAY